MKAARFIAASAVVLALSGLYLWWSRPVRVDMAGYVPSDSLLYIETNDITRVMSGITNTTAWLSLSSGTTLAPKIQSATWLSRIALWTGIGSAEEVILARSQFALVVIALETTDAEPALLIRPALALVIETHTGERRMRPAIEKRIEDLAHKVYPQSISQRKTVDGIPFTEWVSPQDGRKIVLAFYNTEAILGNDERAVLACVAVRHGNRKSLLDNPELGVMRSRILNEDVAAFGYVSAAGLGKLLAAVAPLYVEGMPASPQSQRILGGLVDKIFQSAGWTLGFHDGMVEDRYFLAMPTDLTRQLDEAFATQPNPSHRASLFLPSTTYSFTQYNPRNPMLAWRGLNAALSSRLDILGAVLVTPVLRGALSPYGIEDPEAFLSAVRPEIVTARLDENESNSVIIVPIHDEQTLRKLVGHRLGSNPRREVVGAHEMLISSKEDGLAASFAEKHLLMGPPSLLRRCLSANAQGATVDSLPGFRRSNPSPTKLQPIAVSYYSDALSAKMFFSLLSGSSIESVTDKRDAREIPYAVSTTAISSEGVEKVSRSSSGLVGTIASYFAAGLSGK